GSGLFRNGASLRFQEGIKKTNELGNGGMEYLYSVPGLLGGAIVMNAGRGREYNESISDYIVSVLVFKDGEIHEIKKDDCNFGYRNSIFKTGGCVVIEALMQFEKGDSKLFEKAREERINLVKNAQDTSKPNCGSIFSVSNPSIMRAIMNYIPGKGRVRFSQKTPNWLLNDGGTFSDVEKCLKKAHFFHRLFRKPIQEEVILWR
ncbi:MAG: hypothetical protein LUD78_13145, partial [Clostridiales bacterium]|nr:hypothetical protein [Clostridiales bacterium]